MVKCSEYRGFSARSFDADAGADEKLSSRCQSVAPIAVEHRITYWLHEEIERQCDGCRARAVGGRAGASARLVGRWASTGLASAAKKRSPWLRLGESGGGHPARRVAMRASHW